MSAASLAQLIVLSALWGSSFLFMRIAAPVLGPAMLMETRVLLAALFLFGVAQIGRREVQWRSRWKHYLILGLFNSALPFLLFAYAAISLSASMLAILNATAPIWGSLIAVLWLRKPLSGKSLAGLMLGIAGVALLVGFDRVSMQPGAGLAIAAALAASCSYSIASTYAHRAEVVPPFANAHGSMWAATLIIAPTLPFFPIIQAPSFDVILAVLALGLLCTGIAYLIYFRLIREIGAASALTVTFLIPVFGVLWGYLFLDEVIGWHTFAGAAIVLLGTALVTGFSPKFSFGRVMETDG